MPLHRSNRVASTPGTGLPRRLRNRRHHPSSSVPPAWFLTTSAAFSATRPAGLLHPAAGLEVRRVSRDLLPSTRDASHPEAVRARDRGEAGPFPATQSTLRRVPPARSRAVSPRSVPSMPSGAPRVVAPPAPRCRSAEVTRSEGGPRLRGVAPRTGPWRPTPFRMPDRSFLPWACVPFEVRLPPQPPALRWATQTRHPKARL
jgi:hypothetical protein